MQCGTKAVRTIVLTMALATFCSWHALAQEAPPLTRIAFGSCAHQAKPQPICDAVLDYRPELFVFTGDNVYGDVGAAELYQDLGMLLCRSAAPAPGSSR